MTDTAKDRRAAKAEALHQMEVVADAYKMVANRMHQAEDAAEAAGLRGRGIYDAQLDWSTLADLAGRNVAARKRLAMAEEKAE